ncbi:UTP14 family protein [Aspergillus clavatus NRRL 1]|uniref:Small nucleolar ribonucleoprotein complex subunit Utp14, putatrive n=1 Tax=Aspergillus clavatus (strain ATCC 1007 / CBS 513.65 / DSM 816 / NCTC 3887 / NRRL 1 / QM 1276 / 107) TaxID=344612 RepID=A1CRM4_ASPCL|nr:small nucleolar ribonucleoprotein complex subunit Utp14, putatrive [Aspergillus clavatus NRRL 1]EAW08295.1 small nucleolar ribonucleoprotein complex subunit Utp14, putatrive [Aspergillus clavatus NRRL 1]
MPRKQTQLRGPKDQSFKKSAPKKKSGKALNALSIAEKQFPDKLGVRRNRLGKELDFSKRKRNTGRELDDLDGPDNKRRRTGDDSDDDDSNAGSDGEGRRWRLGQVDSDDDSELDSDEAMGSSDEERFEGFTFRGSSKTDPKPKPKKTTRREREINLSEDVDQSEEEDEDLDDEDDLGEDAIDLTTAWDLNTAEEEKAAAASAKQKKTEDDDSDEYDSGSEDSDESDEESDLSLSEDEADETDAHGLSKLQSFVNAMETKTSKKPTRKTGGGQEHAKPTEYGLTSSRKLTIADLLPSITDSRLKSSLKHVDAAPSHKQASGIPGKLDAPLAKRQQDRLDRVAAYEKSKETLNRWLETVKANRRAEHLTFPLPDPNAQQSHKIGPVKPQTDLEATIQNILVESGLAEANGKSTEEQVQEFEELQARKLPIEEIRARRAELRKRRDLLFREEVRAKRIKKIKSKSYRRVHRKERERMEEQERQALREAGVDLEEEEREMNERRRAEARMGAKHKDSKWAKSLKQTGRTAWDEDARQGAADLALKEEELRRRIEGKSVSRADDDYLGSSSSESEDDDPWTEDAGSDAEKRKLRQKLERLEGGEEDDTELTGPHAKLLSMKFMQNAEASRKAQNDAEIRRLDRELRGEEESQSEAESEVGRRKFGNTQGDKAEKAKKSKPMPKNEFEEALGSDEEAEAAEADPEVDIIVNRTNKQKGSKATEPSGKKNNVRPSNTTAEQKETADVEENPWLVQTKRNNRRTTADDSQQTIDVTLGAEAADGPKKQKDRPSVASKKQQHVEDDNDSDEEDVPVLLKNHDLVKRAFAGDEVVQDFDQEKIDTIEEEGDKVIDETLPGWGSWAGDGVSKRELRRQKKVLTKVEGVKPENRKDAKLSRVIINEKRIRKNNKYLATQLPHPFETKAQYERSLRLPIGPEWSTKETLQNATKPRVMIKQGIIKPMEKPMI